MNFSPTILFAEDSDNDTLLIRCGFEKARFPFSFQFVEDGVEAVQYFTGKGKFADRERYPVPSVLLTDLRMPRMDGFELLEWVRGQAEWRNLPVIVVTGSNQVQDRKRAMDLGANFYIVKDLLMRPSQELLEAIVRCATPPAKPRTRRLHALA